MTAHRRTSCSFMTGPASGEIKVSAVKWWFAISRDVLAKTYRAESSGVRLPAMCHRTPTFTSPLKNGH